MIKPIFSTQIVQSAIPENGNRVSEKRLRGIRPIVVGESKLNEVLWGQLKFHCPNYEIINQGKILLPALSRANPAGGSSYRVHASVSTRKASPLLLCILPLLE